MPLQKLQFRPGLNREGTDYANEGGWFDGDKIRFRSGYPEKIGGWTRLSNNQFVGVARSLWNWIALVGTNYLGVGTSKKYYIEVGGTFNDITPIVQTDTTLLGGGLNANPIATTNGSATVTVTDPAYTPNVGDYILITTTSNVGGLNMNVNGISGTNEYVVQTVDIPNTKYTITALNNATSTATGGGTVTIKYLLPIGLDVFTPGTGFGAGPWGGITPSVTATLGSNPFASTNASSTIVVTHNSHGLNNGYYVAFNGATGFAGIPASMLNSVYIISNKTANTYEITLPSSYTASSTTTGGGSAVVVTMQSGSQGWGTGYDFTSLGQQLRLWSNDNFGQDLVIAPRGGAIYYWQDALGTAYRAEALSDLSTTAGFDGQYVPSATNQVVASAIQRFVIAMGANSYVSGNPNTDFDPMLVRWSDQENPYQWVPETTNQSGEFRLTNGSSIIGARATRQEILIWTDSALYSMQYLGPPYIWGFQVLMDNISVMSPSSMITVQNVTYWMGTDKFYMYSGRVETLPCALRQYIFTDINKDQSYQVFAGSNEGYNEVWWFYCSQGSNAVDKYVIYNYLDRVWYYGSMARTAWLDSGIRQYPMAANYENRILYHESAVDDVSGLTPVAIESYVQSSDFDIGDGHNFGFVWRILPDVNFNGSNVNNPYVVMKVKPRRNSGTAYGTADDTTVISANDYSAEPGYTIQEFTGQVYTRLRGRQMSFRIESDSLGVAWQLGSPRIDIRNDGRR